MSKHKYTKAFIRLSQEIVKLPKSLKAKDINWFLRNFLVSSRRHLQAGFVLPTTVLLLIVMSLVVAALLARTSSRTEQVIAERQQKVISNAASPAIDRAKAKLEYLFSDKNPDLPNGVPGEGKLIELMRSGDETRRYLLGDGTSPESETRLDINNDGTADNAWSYRADTNGDGEVDATIAYSIIGQIPDNQNDLSNQSPTAVSNRATNLLVRNGPVNSTQANPNCESATNDSAPEDGWFVDSTNTATLRKNFQINAVVISDNQVNKSIATLELQQDRQLDRANKWGAWFRYDLQISNVPQFNWNGAMHSEGSFFLDDFDNTITAYLISSPNSCLYSRTASEITLSEITNDANQILFQGQIVNGVLTTNQLSDNDIPFHYVDQNNQPVDTGSTINITQATDSLSGTSLLPANIALDPVILFTQDITKANNVTNWSSVRDTNWQNGNLFINRRIYNQREPKPYVDDTYRADNLYGPKPNYGRDSSSAIPGQIGDAIPSTETELISNDPLGTNTESVGLDGYWERRARLEGLRVIVGQRLELGNPLGQPTTTISHQARQRRALRDNLAAVQATAIYHQANRIGGAVQDLPVACLATTAHPGTATTITNSKTFNIASGTLRLNTDFLTGNGTNGWEFNPPATTETAFANAIASGQPLRIALKNLAYLAGDPFGAFPARQDTTANPAVASAGAQVHPHPLLTAWGNFSELRRVISLLDSGTTYANLSIADKSTLHTASCTLGMLAYKIQSLQIYDYSNATNQTAITASTGLDAALLVLGDNTKNNGGVRYYPSEDLNSDGDAKDTGEDLNGNGTLDSTPNITVFRNGSDNPISRRIVANTSVRPSADDYILGLGNLAKTLQDSRRLAETIHEKEQVKRDRRFGFASVTSVPTTVAKYQYTVASLSATYNYSGKSYNNGNVIQLGFDYTAATGNNFFGFGTPTTAAQVQRFIRLATSLSPTTTELPANQVKYPSLFYLFPVANHNHKGTFTPTALAADPTLVGLTQPAEPYVDNLYIFNTAVTDDVNHNFDYKVLRDTNSNGIEDVTEDGIGAVALQPRARSAWQLPNTTTTDGRVNLITDNFTSATSTVGISFLDKGMFNGREMMNVRVLDFDLDLLRSNTFSTDNWLPQQGIIYAFREDAVREDGIARPAADTWVNCDTSAKLTTTSCNTNATTPKDPPVNPTNGIATKPIDFLPDPDRRPYGFRLRNGADLTRASALDDNRGISFISDNPVYVQGDFNLHSTNGTTSNLLQEFTQALTVDAAGKFTNFYSRTTPEARFGEVGANNDRWRFTEIIADAVTILSDNFCDGSIQDSFINSAVSATTTMVPLADYNCGTGNGVTSYLNQNRPNATNSNVSSYWRRENTSDPTSPIAIDANGSPARLPNGWYSTADGSYYSFNTGAKKPLGAASETRVNSIIVSGLVPSRTQQHNGGLHNFPRFLENWNGTRMHIGGSLIQLNFSTYATAPWDQEAWEPLTLPDEKPPLLDTTVFTYYDAPNRLWGYDVALQMAPAGPVSRRFVTPSDTRSEFYRELPVEDPYIKNLRCAKSAAGGTTVDPSATCP